jgi:hypothetical protein
MDDAQLGRMGEHAWFYVLFSSGGVRRLRDFLSVSLASSALSGMVRHALPRLQDSAARSIQRAWRRYRSIPLWGRTIRIRFGRASRVQTRKDGWKERPISLYLRISTGPAPPGHVWCDSVDPFVLSFKEVQGSEFIPSAALGMFLDAEYSYPRRRLNQTPWSSGWFLMQLPLYHDDLSTVEKDAGYMDVVVSPLLRLCRRCTPEESAEAARSPEPEPRLRVPSISIDAYVRTAVQSPDAIPDEPTLYTLRNGDLAGGVV